MRSRTMRRVSLMLLESACLPEKHSVIGAACNDVTDPCPEDLKCSLGKCTDMPLPDFTVLSSPFETTWEPWSTGAGAQKFALVATPKHLGSSSVHVSGADSLPPNAYTKRDELVTDTGLHCVSAWLMHGMSNGPITMEFRSYKPNGATHETTPIESFAVPDAGKAWGQLTTQLSVDVTQVNKLELVIKTGPAPADFYMDDVTIIRTAKPSCP